MWHDAHFSHGFPFCDVCREPAVNSKFFGWRHCTSEYPHGVPEYLDVFLVAQPHVITAADWYNGKPRFEGADSASS
jgi:hypothetical protein